MKFETLLMITGDLPYFDLQTLVQMTNECRASINNQLSRWRRAGKVVSLRRGMYVLGDAYRKNAVLSPELANIMYRPSYISGAYALSFYGYIPESVPVYTCVTSRKPRRFENAFGTFVYQHMQPSVFGGFEVMSMSGRSFKMARLEKALFDSWYLSTGGWNEARMREMRYDMERDIDTNYLLELVNQAQKPRLERAYDVFCREKTSTEDSVTI